MEEISFKHYKVELPRVTSLPFFVKIIVHFEAILKSVPATVVLGSVALEGQAGPRNLDFLPALP